MAIERPTYRVLVPGRQHFDCQPLRGPLSTADCAKRWAVAPKGSACADCRLGQLHHSDHLPTSSTTVQQACPNNACLRCGRTDLRIILLERTHAGKVQRHAWCCEGEPCGAAWQIAPVRIQVQALDAGAAAALLGTDTHPAPERDNYGLWVPTGFLCGHCNAGQLEGKQPAPKQPWQVRCRGCGTSSG